ncbi:MAG: hypothetical protein OFPII_27080 [Osedax symbiont Rs1]|nr:MAG: hypothetical protein OFPII_27080 [Osedax symbiont Rs1]
MTENISVWLVIASNVRNAFVSYCFLTMKLYDQKTNKSFKAL